MADPDFSGVMPLFNMAQSGSANMRLIDAVTGI
jgi:hypothetical protein